MALQEELEEEGSLGNDSDSDFESETSDSEDQEESIGLFYAAQRQEIISPEENYGEGCKEGIPQEITNLIKEFPENFPKSIEELGEIKDSKFQIDVPEDESPPRCGMRRYAEMEKRIIYEEVSSMLKSGIVRKSTSPLISPVQLVPKSNGKYRFCVDYRKLNSLIPRDKFPLPRIDNCVDKLAHHKYYSTLDCMSGYL
ncbi:hypothetical protein AYI69_g4798 [Smittium culicis]|uniref:Transposon Ty3-I Gag-Pol polyprotein n=1 Tax=Smittium culicis TaxID=133412 RepID=A0A1R1YBC4_9FUNG|nr:hypothetical protein AYI69_g4798 [Smittium culicis]